MNVEVPKLMVEAQPRYLRLAHALLDDIQQGRYAVGDLLPTEKELSETGGVSRHTVRDAIRMLYDLGLVSRQPGVGTRVTASSPPSRYVQTSESVSDLQQYVSDTRLDIKQIQEVVADEALAGLLQCEIGKRWIHMYAVRYVGKDGPVFALTNVFVDLDCRGIVPKIGELNVPIYTLIEKKLGQPIVEVRQEISAREVSPDDAKILNVKSKSAALLVTRRYFAAGDRLCEVAVNIHPAGRYSYAMTFQREEWKRRGS